MYDQIRALIAQDMNKVDQFVIDQLRSNVGLVESIGHYIVEAGGKRLRPMLVLLAAGACNHREQSAVEMAGVIEFIHTATLLHDDVVDMSSLRRGRPTVNAEWNNPSSVLVGDFIYSRAFQMLVRIGSMDIMRLMADTTNRIAEGEVLQLISKGNPNTTEDMYRQVIEAKTAILFQAAAHSGALLAGASVSQVSALQQYGMELGRTFQLIDDLLDYAGDADSMGKNLGDDLAEGKPTLPLIRTHANGDDATRKLIEQALRADNIDEETAAAIFQRVHQGDGLDYTRDAAKRHASAALQCLDELPDSEYLQALRNMVAFALARSN